MEEVEYGGIVVGVIWILGGVLVLLYPKYIFGYRKWTKEKQESFNIKGFARLLSIVCIIFGINYIVTSIFGDVFRLKYIMPSIYLFVIIFKDRLFTKKPKTKT